MAALEYKGHPLQRKDNFIYYGSFADKYIIMMQILETKKVKDLDVATKVSVQLQLTDDSWPLCGWSVRWLPAEKGRPRNTAKKVPV